MNPERDRRRLAQIGLVTAAVLFTAGAVIAVLVSSDEHDGGVQGGSQAAAIFVDIPQDGKVLGAGNAPVVMSEYADLQCPFCARYANTALPELVRRYVRRGELRLELHVGRFLGSESDPAARAAAAAAAQNRLWQFAEVWYRNQGAENSGYVTDEFIRDVADAVPGLDAHRVLRDLDAPHVEREVAAVDARAQRLDVSATPTFFLARPGKPPIKLGLADVETGSFTDSLDRLIGGER